MFSLQVFYKYLKWKLWIMSHVAEETNTESPGSVLTQAWGEGNCRVRGWLSEGSADSELLHRSTVLMLLPKWQALLHSLSLIILHHWDPSLDSGGWFMTYYVWNISREGEHPHWHNYFPGPLKEWFLLIKWHLLPQASQSQSAFYQVLAHHCLSLLLLVQVGAKILNSSSSSLTYLVCL